MAHFELWGLISQICEPGAGGKFVERMEEVHSTPYDMQLNPIRVQKGNSVIKIMLNWNPLSFFPVVGTGVINKQSLSKCNQGIDLLDTQVLILLGSYFLGNWKS
jgi:hypothetical protein